MSVPIGWGLAAAAMLIGLPVVAATGALEARQRAAGAADAAAIAAADAVSGWLAGEPCAVAGEVAAAARVELLRCEIEGFEARVWVRASTPLGPATARSRAGPEDSGADGP